MSDVVKFGPFGDRATVNYVPPVNTLDPRYDACTDHHVACDCREAEFAEYRSESIADRRMVEQAFAKHLAGHPTVSTTGPGCQCIGCEIARSAQMHSWRWQHNEDVPF